MPYVFLSCCIAAIVKLYFITIFFSPENLDLFNDQLFSEGWELKETQTNKQPPTNIMGFVKILNAGNSEYLVCNWQA